MTFRDLRDFHEPMLRAYARNMMFFGKSLLPPEGDNFNLLAKPKGEP